MKKERVVISAVHPQIGQLYWWYVEEDSNLPDNFGLTDYRPNALRLPDGWREHDYLHWKHRTHLGQVFNPDLYGTDYHEEMDDDCEDLIISLTGSLANLQARSGQSIEEFRRWAFKADWVDIPISEDAESGTKDS